MRHDQDLHLLTVWSNLVGLFLEERHKTKLALGTKMRLWLFDEQEGKPIGFSREKKQLAGHEKKIVGPQASRMRAFLVEGHLQLFEQLSKPDHIVKTSADGYPRFEQIVRERQRSQIVPVEFIACLLDALAFTKQIAGIVAEP